MRREIAGVALATGLILSGCGGEQHEAAPTPAPSPDLNCDQPGVDPLIVEDCEAVVRTKFTPYYPVIKFALENVTVYHDELPKGPVKAPTDVTMVLLDETHSKEKVGKDHYSADNSLGFYERETRVDRIFNADTMDADQLQVISLHELDHAHRNSLIGYGIPKDESTTEGAWASVREEVDVTSTTYDFMKQLYGQKYADYVDRMGKATYDASGVFPEITQAELESVLDRKLDEDEFEFFKGAVKTAAGFEALDLTYGKDSVAARNYKIQFEAEQLGLIKPAG